MAAVREMCAVGGDGIAVQRTLTKQKKESMEEKTVVMPAWRKQ